MIRQWFGRFPASWRWRLGVGAMVALGLAEGSAGVGVHPAAALSIAQPAGEGADPLAGAPRIRGRVVSAESAFGADDVLRTEVVLADEAGAEVGRFAVPGGRVGSDFWVVDGVPVFMAGEVVDVALAPTGAGWTVADGEGAVVRLAPAANGRSGALLGATDIDPALVPHVETIDPDLSGAAPDRSTLVRIRGALFGATQGSSRVTFQGLFERIDAAVASWSDNEIQCFVPAPGLLGVPQVLSGPPKVWTAVGGWSDGSEFVGGPRFRVLYQWAGDSWPLADLPVPVYVNPSGFPWGAATGPIVADVLARWNVPGSFGSLVYRGLTQAQAGPHRESGPRSGDDRNTVSWRTTWPHNPGWLAVTWSRLDTLTYVREETDLEINGELYRWSITDETPAGAYDFPSTMVHEFGHWLRLGHTQSISSVMLASIGPGQQRREPSPSDKFGASWIYPSYGTLETFSALDHGQDVVVRIGPRDREGREQPGLAADRITMRLLPLVPGLPEPSAVDPPLATAPVAVVNAAGPTDAFGLTTASVTGLPDGRYRVEVSVDNELVRPAPVVTVGTPPAVPAPVLALAGVTPQPLPGGVRGTVRFSLAQSTHVELALYDVRGARVRELASERLPAGPHEVALWTREADGTSLAPGVYFLRLSAVAGASFAPLTSRVVVLP